MLGELVGCFLDLFRGKILPAGSTVVLFSTTHLLMRGLSGYVSDLSTEMNRLDRVFRGGILSMPGIPILTDGCSSRTVTREILELGNGLKILVNLFRPKLGRLSDPELLRIRRAGFCDRKKPKFWYPKLSEILRKKNLG